MNLQANKITKTGNEKKLRASIGFAAVSVLVAVSSLPARAENGSGDPGWYGVGSVGRSRLDDSSKNNVDSALTTGGVTGLSSSMDDHDTAYKLQLGYKFTPNWAVEGGYVDLGKFDYRANFTGGSANGQAKANGWNIAGVGTYPINEQFSVFGKLGMIDARVKENVSASGAGGTVGGNESATKWKANFGVGATYNVARNWGLRAELERFDKLGDNSNTGESNVNLLSLGVAYSF